MVYIRIESQSTLFNFFDSRSRSRSRSRERRDKKSRERRRSRSNSPKSPLQYSGPKIQLEEKEETKIDIIKRNKAIEEIEKSGFEQKNFTKTANAATDIKPDFEFATAAEKASCDTDKASKVIEQLESEGLCHPLWFQDPEERETKYLRYLTSLKKKLVSSGKYKA